MKTLTGRFGGRLLTILQPVALSLSDVDLM